MNDRTLMIERMIALVAELPHKSLGRRKVTEVLVHQLWDSLPHPPVHFVGDFHKYRQLDGSHNSLVNPNLGKAGSPYARTVLPRHQSTEKPDPGMLFDLLMGRGDNYEVNPCGISSMLIYHAALITHDIFHSNRQDATINETSSYLDLSPLYGRSLKETSRIRTFRDGQLKPDSFCDKRLLGFPSGVCVMLIMYSRFHNYVAANLAAINEGERFTPPRHLVGEEALSWKDEQLFQVARLVTNGLYANISLHDYLRAIANVPSIDSTWTLDPRPDINRVFKTGPERGVGNQVSCEFNLLYRFHSAISDRDAKWTENFFRSISDQKDPHTISLPDLMRHLAIYERNLPEDPTQWTFDGLQRTATGRFKDDDLVAILKESIEDPAGRFGANHVPDIMKPIEILGIIQARKWNVASLNEFREFFQLNQYKTFEELNPDPYVASTLKKLYKHPDNVELYPGMFLESVKPRMDCGMGLCAPYTVTRAVFSDAITLVRSDRFLTTDYLASNLTSWGITEVASEPNILGGARMHQLILNAFPKYFKFNSVYAMQPFYTPKENRNIFYNHGTADLYSFDPPSLQPPVVPVTTHAGLMAVLADNANFRVPWGAKMASLQTYMLAGDTPNCAAQRNVVKDALYSVTDANWKFVSYTKEITLKLLRREAYVLGREGADIPTYQVDIVNIGNLVALHFASALCYLPLLTTSDESYSEDSMYKTLCDLTTYVFSDADPTKSWARRQQSQDATAKLCETMEKIVKGISKSERALSFGSQCPAYSGHVASFADYGVNFARKFLDNGRSTREVAEILVGTASAFVANTATAFAQLIDFYLKPENAAHWGEIQRLSALDTDEADDTLTTYVLEGMRLSNSLGLLRIVEPVNGETAKIGETTVHKGDCIFISFVAACNDPSVFPSPRELLLNRPRDAYITFGTGPHQCLGNEIATLHCRTILKVLAKLGGLRRTPGSQGILKSVDRPGGTKLYLTPDLSKLTPYPTTMKLMWEGKV
ncbi:heme peroxidase [Geopyxis carbonaria]|nr:heme peroxidase [Geopyxis carbonaria]